MSVEENEEAGGKILVLICSGKLTSVDYANYIPEVVRSVKTHGTVQLRNFHGWAKEAACQHVELFR